ncbi:hypothetical protein BC940DRAFT_302567 [Gongronella butleri]|nr:hypothetical protein BC940DRAFT_302567 [Gongronella butleri]
MTLSPITSHRLLAQNRMVSIRVPHNPKTRNLFINFHNTLPFFFPFLSMGRDHVGQSCQLAPLVSAFPFFFFLSFFCLHVPLFSFLPSLLCFFAFLFYSCILVSTRFW